MLSSARRIASLLLAVTGLIAFGAATAGADAPPNNLELIESQIKQIERHEAAERNRVDSDELVIRQLEQQLQTIKARDANLVNQDQQLELSNTQLKTQTEQQLEDVKAQLAQGISPSDFASGIDRYLGTHQFTWNGAVAGCSPSALMRQFGGFEGERNELIVTA
jgi:TolA-binding protein